MHKVHPLQSVLAITTVLIAWYLISDQSWFLYAALGLGLSCALSASIANYIHTGWMKLAVVLGWVVPKIVFTLLFFLLLTPIAWLSRRLGPSDPLRLHNNGSSTFQEVDKRFEPSDFEKTW